MRRVTPRGFAPRGVQFGKASHAQIANPLPRHRRPLGLFLVSKGKGVRGAKSHARSGVGRPDPRKGTRNRHQTVTSAGGPKRAVGKRLGC